MKSPPRDQVDRAVFTPPPEQFLITLSSGRQIPIILPLDLKVLEMLELVAILSSKMPAVLAEKRGVSGVQLVRAAALPRVT